MTIQCGFVFTWEYKSPSSTDWIGLLAKEFITVANMFTALSVVAILLVFDQLLAVYYKVAATELDALYIKANNKKGSINLFKEAVRIVKQLQRLNLSARLVNVRLNLLLNVVCCWTVIHMVSVTYFFVLSVYQRQIVGAIWDIYQLLEHFIRIIVICHTTDRIQKAVIRISIFIKYCRQF